MFEAIEHGFFSNMGSKCLTQLKSAPRDG